MKPITPSLDLRDHKRQECIEHCKGVTISDLKKMANCRGINPGVPKHKAGKSPANFR